MTLSRIRNLILVLAAVALLAGCVSYRQIYGKIDKGSDRLIFETLVYWVEPERIETIMEADRDKKNMMCANEVEQIAARLNMEPREFKKQQLRRVKYVNMNFGFTTKGIFTDKGRIWIKYGEPGQVREGVEDDVYGVVEKWVYGGGMRTFIFTEQGSLINLIEDDI